MNKKTLVWTLIVAVPVGLAALATAFIYRDTGKLPFQQAAETTTAPAGPTETGQVETAVSPQDASTPEETAQSETAPDQDQSIKGPSFDVVGVEPTGETVVAGRSDAGAIVALTANGKVVGKSIANEAGEWTIILDEPLKPGDYDVGLEVHDEAGDPVATSEERLAVSLPEGGKEQPLVVLNSPDGPSDVLQKPETEQQVAAVQPEQEPQQQAAAEPTAPTGDAAPQNTQAASAPQADDSQQPETSASQQAKAEPAAPAAEQVAAASQESQPASSDQIAPAAQAEAGEAETASGDAAQVAAAEGTGNTSQPEATETAATTSSDNGSAPAAAEQTAAAAQTPETDAGEETQVASRSVQPSEPAQSEDQPAAAASEQPASQVEQAPADNQPVEATAPATLAPQPEAAPAEPTVTVEAVESETDKVFVAGTGEPGSSVRVYVGDEFQGEAEVNASGKWLVQGTKNIAEGNVEVRADLIAEDGNAVDARAAVTFEKEQDKQIVLTKVVASGASGDAAGQGAEVKKTLPVVIIRKGDNLWRISRRLYGEGVRYTTIYQANQDQIRNPDLIYPGQVFLTPEGDLNWKQPVENNG
ncbi:LysM peptidoglycan-binding domain-containing protein [Labrenzia sp. VG12]|uniref:LysM peptidoglycan-binding domain-containing protein n=1 Tax=Labrenzia sp. VG12 TaxID=2021862 RepID=UPI000B8C5556|nr:LysM peptidoglycan-binding domain-containing protein [Labrenzia sp. VG12]ASP32317.1 peptidoglycan-binding protein LysM [Labrenzia sp. VG12]